MKKSTRSLLKGLAMACLLAIGGVASAATYTAVATGAYTSTSTWGGVAPPANVTADNITIPNGIVVYLDQNVSISGSSNLTVAGQLNSLTTEDLAVTNGASFSGAGSITVDSLTLGGPSASLAFIGNVMARTVTSLGLTIASGATFTVTESVKADDGLLTLTTVNFTLNNNGKIYMAGGTIAVGISANLNLNTYDVVYTDVTAYAGVELTGSGLRNVFINVPSNATVFLTQHATMTDTLWLNSGVLDLNGNNLTFAGDGNIGATGSGTISSTAISNIIINSDNSFLGPLTFTAGADELNALVINFSDNTATVKLGSDLNLTNQLLLQGGKVDVDGNSLYIGTGGSISGGSANSYVITSNLGDLTMNLGTGTTGNFMIGTATNFAPVAVTINPGSTGGDVSALVEAGLLAGGIVGTNLAATQPVVNATWLVATSATSNINMNVSPMWSAAMEVNGFNRSEAFVSMNDNGTWDVQTAAAATASGSLYTLTRSNVTADVAAFAVMDKDAVNNVEEVKVDNGFVVYPNPVVNTLYFKTTASLRDPVQVNIYDVAGHLVKTVTADNNGVPISELAAGFYTAQFSSGDHKATERFVKQ